MKAKYDFERMQADCTEWCNNPVFPYPWQEGWRFYGRPEFVIRNEKDSVVAKWHLPTAGIIPFAHMIGLDVESYRIKESYKSAVERYLATIPEGQPLWEGSPFTKHTQLLAPPVIWASYLDAKCCFCLAGEFWSTQGWHPSYHFLRLDLNPDYQVEG